MIVKFIDWTFFMLFSAILVPLIIAGFLIMNFIFPFWEDWLEKMS